MTARHPDSPRTGDEGDELNDATREAQRDLGQPQLTPELSAEERDELADDSAPGQNSDWMPQ